MHPTNKSSIMEKVRMPSQAQPALTPEYRLAQEMGISFEILSRAIGPKSARLPVLLQVWSNLLVVAGDKEHARRFLSLCRPELEGSSPLEYLDNGDPEPVLGLVIAMREMLP